MTRMILTIATVLCFAAPAFGQNAIERFWMVITGPDGENISLGNLVGTPEPRALRQLGLGTHRLIGPVHAIINPALQRATTIGAATALVAIGFPVTRAGDRIGLPSVTLDVIPGCSGFGMLRTLGLIAFGVACAACWWRRSWAPGFALLGAAPLIALGMNALRVASVGYGLEVYGFNLEHPFEWAGWTTFGLGTLLILGLGVVLSRSGAPAPK